MDIYLSSPQVGLAVDGEESRLVFLDHPHGAIKLENLLNTYKYLHIYNIYGYLRIYLRSPAAILVVMAVDEVESFQLAEHILVYLSHTGHIGDKVGTRALP